MCFRAYRPSSLESTLLGGWFSRVWTRFPRDKAARQCHEHHSHKKKNAHHNVKRPRVKFPILRLRIRSASRLVAYAAPKADITDKMVIQFATAIPDSIPQIIEMPLSASGVAFISTPPPVTIPLCQSARIANKSSPSTRPVGSLPTSPFRKGFTAKLKAWSRKRSCTPARTAIRFWASGFSSAVC
jgi:hypothetical protein